MRAPVIVLLALLAGSCVYFNAMYDAQRQYGRAMDLRRQGSDGQAELYFDSVIVNATGILDKHARSKYGPDAALLKTRSELEKRFFEAARETAALVPLLTDDPDLVATARGLEGVALRQFASAADTDQQAEAVALLTEGLSGDISDDDRARFRFHRGVARLAIGDAQAAAEDLAAVQGDVELDSRIRQDLAKGLFEAGQFEPSLQVVDQLLRESRFASLQTGTRTLLDSLSRRNPTAVAAMLAAQLEQPEVPEAKRSLLILMRGRALEWAADTASAIDLYASIGQAGGLDAAHARYRHALLLSRRASEPADIVRARDILTVALSGAGPAIFERVQRLLSRTREFADLVAAYESRGATAAEAALRAAEIAGAELSSPRVSRGLYLRYLELAPRSPWRAKAMAGALLHRDTPAGDWAGDRGAATDDELRRALEALPTDDPYRVAIADLPRTALLDSAYVVAEMDLRRRLVEIRMLYDTTAAFVAPTDSVVEEAPEPEPDDPQSDDGVEF